VIPVLLILLAAYWLAAPDPATAGARTAAGSGVRAAGSGARQHWASGRDGRQLRRTGRRDRWSKSGGFWRNLLRLEHGAVIGGKAAKGAAGITAAAARPVPAAVKRGWVQGMERHQRRAGNRPAGLALDPPWWHRQPAPEPGTGEQVQPADPQVQDAGTGREQVQVQAGDSPEGQVGDTFGEQVPTTARGHDLPPEFKPGDRLVDGTGKPWTVRDVRPQIDADTYDLVDNDGAPGYADIPRPDRWKAITEQDDPTDPPAGTSPAGTPSTSAIPTQGDPVPSYTTTANVPSVELNDLDSVRRFAEYIASLGEDSEFMQIVKQCKSFREQLREGGFGGHMDAAGSSFEETAGRLGQVGEEFCEEAQQVAGLAVNIAGG
jgi:hypothetical protein